MPELRVASSHGVGGFQQVVAEITVAGFNHPRMFRLKVTGLVPRVSESFQKKPMRYPLLLKELLCLRQIANKFTADFRFRGTDFG